MTDEEKPIRHFSTEEANALLPKVAPLVEQLRDAHALMEARQDEVTESIPTNGGGAVHRHTLSELPGAGVGGKAVKLMYLTDPDGVRIECMSGTPDLG